MQSVLGLPHQSHVQTVAGNANRLPRPLRAALGGRQKAAQPCHTDLLHFFLQSSQRLRVKKNDFADFRDKRVTPRGQQQSRHEGCAQWALEFSRLEMSTPLVFTPVVGFSNLLMTAASPPHLALVASDRSDQGHPHERYTSAKGEEVLKGQSSHRLRPPPLPSQRVWLPGQTYPRQRRKTRILPLSESSGPAPENLGPL